ncbi:hypothetical protein PSEUDO9AZ_40170 [Pseudomonas sp. 9AZ]|nr:hypothetical protein PSEUDO9AZ_40170 [Pseudomonas sp. 9AZ]
MPTMEFLGDRNVINGAFIDYTLSPLVA